MTDDWADFGGGSWADDNTVRARLQQGADPNTAAPGRNPPLHTAAEYGSAAVVALFAQAVDDVDAIADGRTALWRAVAANRPDNAGALVAAGADPFMEMMAGWTPARLSLAGPTPDLFDHQATLTPREFAVVRESARLISIFDHLQYVDGYGIAGVAGIDAAEAVRRLGAQVVEQSLDTDEDDDEYDDDEDDGDDEGDDLYVEVMAGVMWATTVPGGCVVAQRFGYEPYTVRVTSRLSVGTTCYGMFANPKSGNQGSITRNGEVLGWDVHPGGEVRESDDADAVLLGYLYQYHPLAFCHAYVGLAPTDSRAISGPPDLVIRMP